VVPQNWIEPQLFELPGTCSSRQVLPLICSSHASSF
jgi:hypothetical protein